MIRPNFAEVATLVVVDEIGDKMRASEGRRDPSSGRIWKQGGIGVVDTTDLGTGDPVARPAGTLAFVMRDVEQGHLRMVAQFFDRFLGTVLPSDAEVERFGIGGLGEAVEHGRDELRVAVGGDLDEDSGH